MKIYYVTSSKSSIMNWLDPDFQSSFQCYDEELEEDGRKKIHVGKREFLYFITPTQIEAIQQYEFMMYIDIDTTFIGQIDLELEPETYQTYYIYRTDMLNDSDITYKLNKIN